MNDDEIKKRYFEDINKDIDEILSQTTYDNTEEISKKIQEMANRRYPEYMGLARIMYMQDLNLNMLIRMIKEKLFPNE